MAVPKIIVRWQSRLDKTITVHGVVTGATSARVSMPAGSDPQGAVGQPEVDLTLNAANEFTHTFSALPYGVYALAVVRATNGEGTTVASLQTGGVEEMRLYAPGTAPVGTPRALLPAFVAPAFSAATFAYGSELTTFSLHSTSTLDETNVPFTFGQPFRASALAPGDFLVGKIPGLPDVPLQMNVKATHQNGSVRHAIISGKLPSLAAGGSVVISVVRSATGPSMVPLAPSAMLVGGLSADINITIGGVAYSASPAAALAAGGSDCMLWLGGSILTEYIVTVPFISASQEVHPYLVAKFGIRRYVGTTSARVDVVVEHAKAYAGVGVSATSAGTMSDITYTGKVLIGGVERFNIAKSDGTALVHFPTARWRRVFWWQNPSPVHIKHNARYLCDSYQLPNYDKRIVVPESTLVSYAASMSNPQFGLLGTGLFRRGFSDTGGRQDIGLAPGWYACWVVSQDKRAKDLMLALADCSGSFLTHRRDNVEGSPGLGYPVSVINYPRSTTGNLSDSRNSASGQYEKFPTHITTNTSAPDNSHQPAFAYIPYSITGDYFYLEELQFWAAWNLYTMNPGMSNRYAERGITTHGQVRGQAWNLRSMAQAAAITPDDHPLKATSIYFYQNNLSRLNELYTDNPDAISFGVATYPPSQYNAVTYDMPLNRVIPQGGKNETYDAMMKDTGIGLYQDDFFTSSIGHGAELGFPDALRVLRWKARFPILRMTDPACCWWRAAGYPQDFYVRPTIDSPWFATIGEAWAATHSVASRSVTPLTQAYLDLINFELVRPASDIVLNQMTGYTGTHSYSANMQPGLAMAVDSGIMPSESALAWERFDTRAKQPNYGEAAQFGIVSRQVTLDIPDTPPDPEPDPNPDPDDPNDQPVPEDFYQAGSGQIIYIGVVP